MKPFILICCLLLTCSIHGQGIVFEGGPPKPHYPTHTILILKNNNHDEHTETFESQMRFFKNWVYGQSKLETQKVLYFSRRYSVDSNFLRQSVINIRSSLPKGFWDFSIWGNTFDNSPNQDSIWFMYLFAEIDKRKNLKIFSAYKITFEGDDATKVAQRHDPKIRNIEFILDKKAIMELEKTLQPKIKAAY